MYQALYRKYRPTNFDEVVGQDVIINTLKNAITNNKISHAYLFTGPRGTGKTSIAKILGKTVNCQMQKNGVACENCVVCTQIKNKTFSDIIEIDAASNNGVDEIRDIRNKVNLVPTVGKYKVYIIDEVHMLTTGAFNALLKTLEEPPEHIIFVLATTEPHKIPATILSRCQRFDFKKIPEQKLVTRLKYIATEEKIEITDEALNTIAKVSDGGMRDSINLLDQVNSYKNSLITDEDVHKVNGSLSSEAKLEFINNILIGDIANILKQIEGFNDDGKNLVKVLEEINMYLKDELYKIINKEEISINIDVNQLIELIENINNNLINIKQANDTRLAVELLMIKLCNKNNEIKPISKKIEVKQVIEKPEVKKEINVVIEKNDFETSTETTLTSNIDLTNIINRRVDNALANFKKAKYTEIKKKLKGIEDYITDPKYANIASLLLDGELKAASDEYLIFVYNTENSANEFNKELIKIEELIAKILQLKYKAISVPNISWEIIKNDFNNHTREFKYEPENFDIKKINSKNEKELDSLFDNIIEYE